MEPESRPAPGWRDRWSGDPDGVVVLDLGEQPASDYFPRIDEPTPDPRYPTRMVMAASSGLLQLEEDATAAEEVMGVEPAALVRQAEASVADAAAAGLIVPAGRVLHYSSPHGGSWRTQLAPFGLVEVADGEAELLVDVHGMMHDADQKAALIERVHHLAADGVLLMVIFNATAIVQGGMWNALRNGHFAYYTTPVLVEMARELGLVAIGGWSYPLYNNGTTMLAFARAGSRWGGQAASVTALIEAETAAGMLDPVRVSALGSAHDGAVAAVREYLDGARAQGLRVAGYSAASRAVALLTSAGATREDVAVIADASSAKHGRAMPVTRIPIVSPDELLERRPDRVLLFVSDLLPEVRAALPGVEESGARWVIVDPVPREVEPLTH
ncbi:class I SAM-dependent methyltransferase [Gryllotalpicola kribbensis]|uniref:Class I SAM-dependent methyltransferase n=1 Tax=Gryllotalpicola kribbensis TaxID=993084 RepID=A0ABP8AVG9_9MICO